MDYLQAFILGAVFSFFGSVPPGTLNLCVLQLGLEGKIKTALRFAIAVTLIEYPYTWIAIKFELLVTSSPMVISNFRLITAVVMITMGVFTLLSSQKKFSMPDGFYDSGFRRGLVLSILNPMAIPFWIGVTAYLKAQRWIDISTPLKEHSYIFGTAVGVMGLLTLFTFLAKRIGVLFQGNRLINLAPGILLVVLGLYAFARYLW